MIKVRGQCPMGCGETLFVGHGGCITCSFVGCENPTAVNVLLLRPVLAPPPHVEQRFTVRVLHRHSGFDAADVHEALVHYDARSRAPHEEPSIFFVEASEPEQVEP